MIYVKRSPVAQDVLFALLEKASEAGLAVQLRALPPVRIAPKESKPYAVAITPACPEMAYDDFHREARELAQYMAGFQAAIEIFDSMIS